MAGLIRRMPKRKTVKSKKDRWEVLLFAKPFRNLVPECEPRDWGSIGGFLYSMPESLKRIQTNSDTQTDVLGFKVYSRTPEIAQGGIKNVTGSHSKPGDGLGFEFAEESPPCCAEHLDKGKKAGAKPVLG